MWDDVPCIVDNPAIEHFRTSIAHPAAVNTTSGRPLVGLSLAVNYALGGRDPLGYHLFNVLVHAAAALVLFAFVRRLALLPRWNGRFSPQATVLALGVAAVWALHPLQTQAVTYVIQRSEALMGLCYLLTLWLFLRSAGSPRPALWRSLAVAACAVGMTAKEVMASAPLVVLLFDRTFLSGSFRRALKEKQGFYAALFGTWIILFALVAELGFDRDGSTGGLTRHAAWTDYWLTQFPALATYLKLAFVPHPLVFHYGAFWLPHAIDALPAASIVIPLLVLTSVALFRWPTVGFFGFWFFAILAATSVVPGTVDMVADHRMYLALAPLWILVAAGLYRLCPAVAPLLLVAIAIAFAVVTVVRNRDYRTPLALWTDNVAKRPNDGLARQNLAVAEYNLAIDLTRQAKADQAIAEYRAVVRDAPGFARAHNNLGILLFKAGRLEEAGREFQIAAREDSSDRSAQINLAAVHFRLGTADLTAGRPLSEAIAEFTEAVRWAPEFADAQYNLAASLEHAGDLGGALVHYRAAAALQPGDPEIQSHISRLLSVATPTSPVQPK